MAYTSTHPTAFGTVGALFTRMISALASAPESIVQDRQRAAVVLLEKSDDELARMGLARGRIAQDVHSHLYYS